MLKLANVDQSIEAIHEHLNNGQALAKFEEMVVGSRWRLRRLASSRHRASQVLVTADQRRHCWLYPPWSLACLPCAALAVVKSDPLDYETGIVSHKKWESIVKKGTHCPYFMNENSQERVTEFKKMLKILKGLRR